MSARLPEDTSVIGDAPPRPKLYLWRISQSENRGYDTFGSAIVAAATRGEARKTSPSFWDDKETRAHNGVFQERWTDCDDEWGANDTWAHNVSSVTVEFIGHAAVTVGPGIILASFNAG